jgi:hypothetical protein
VAQIHQITDLVAAPLAVATWLWLAWANGRGEDWARLVSLASFALLTLSLIQALADHAATYAPATTIAAAAVWFLGLASLGLIFTPAANRYYRLHAPLPVQKN